jgi:hypothetical protein
MNVDKLRAVVEMCSGSAGADVDSEKGHRRGAMTLEWLVLWLPFVISQVRS